VSLGWGSRLDAMIARLTAQRTHLAAAAECIAGVPGPVLEVGLGKGRTYDHLRTLLPERPIHVFDGSLHAPEGARPPADRLTLGDFRHTLPAAAGRLPPAALIHADIGSDDREADAALAASIAPLLAAMLASEGLLLGDRAMPAPQLADDPGPQTDWPYFRYRRA